MLLRKGVFSYEWFDDIKKLDGTVFQPIEAFYSLTGEGVSEESYEHGQKVWKKRGFKTMRNYHDFYCTRCPTTSRCLRVPARAANEDPRVGSAPLLLPSRFLSGSSTTEKSMISFKEPCVVELVRSLTGMRKPTTLTWE